MATKKTVTKDKTTTSTKGAPKAKVVKVVKAPKVTIVTKARHPKARVAENHTSKEALAKSLAPVVTRAGEDTDAVEARLKTASNAQLLRLSKVTATVKSKYGNREKLIAAIGTAENKSKDKDYIAKLETFSLPQLLDLAAGADRRARAAKAG